VTAQSPRAPAKALAENAPQAKGSKPPQGGRAPKTVEIGGPEGPEPTRYGDWERNGRCSDF
jgi:hypothetical protein